MKNNFLLEYYLGTLDDDERLKVEESLLNSRELLEGYISLKRAFELNDDSKVIPSSELKMRLREQVKNEFKRAPNKIQSSLDFLITKQAWTIAAAAVLIVAIFSLTQTHFNRSPVEPIYENSGFSGASIDSANVTPITQHVL